MNREKQAGDRLAGDFLALRTLAWHRGTIGKGKPVPADVPEGVLREWDARGWLATAERPAGEDPSPAGAPGSREDGAVGRRPKGRG